MHCSLRLEDWQDMIKEVVNSLPEMQHKGFWNLNEMSPIGVILDCYQHSVNLEDLPQTAREHVINEQDDGKRAAKLCLNHDKALRITISEQEKERGVKRAA